MPLPSETLETIRALRRDVRLKAERRDGRCGAVSEAIEGALGLPRQWGHLLLLDGSVCWLHCWNQSVDGSIIDATADQFEALFPGDVLLLAPTDPLTDHYLTSPPGRTFDIQQDDRGQLHLSVDGVDRGLWTDASLAWVPIAEVVLHFMSPWPQPASVGRFVADHLRRRGPGRSFTKRDLEGPIDLWAWESRMADRSAAWLPADLELDAEGKLRAREHPARVHPVGSRRELHQAIDLAERSFPGLDERTGRGPEFYLNRLADEADLQVVAVAEGRVVGVALASLSPERTTAIVGEVAVEPSYRLQGVGRAMLDELAARAAARGLLHLALGADEHAAPFYLACGWQAKVQVTVTGSQRTAVLGRLLARELVGHAVGDEQQEGDAIRMQVSAEGYDSALAARLSAVSGCSAFVMFVRALPAVPD